MGDHTQDEILSVLKVISKTLLTIRTASVYIALKVAFGTPSLIDSAWKRYGVGDLDPKVIDGVWTIVALLVALFFGAIGIAFLQAGWEWAVNSFKTRRPKSPAAQIWGEPR